MPDKYKNEVSSALAGFSVVFFDKMLDFIEGLSESDASAALIMSDEISSLSSAISHSANSDIPIIRIIANYTEEHIVNSIKLGFDECVSLSNIIRLPRAIRAFENSYSNKRKSSKIKIAGIKKELLEIFDLMPNMVLLKDADTFNYVYINRKGEELLGVSLPNIIGKNVFDLVPEKYAEIFHQKDLLTLKSTSPVLVEDTLLPTKRGEIKCFESVKILIQNGDKNKKYILEFSLDNTLRRSIKEELETTQSRFDKIFVTSPNILIIESLQTRTLMNANPAFEKLTGRSKSELIGKSFKDLGVWIDDYKIEEMLSAAIDTGKAHNHSVRLMDANGELKYYLISIDYLSIENKECMLYTGQDITDKSEGEIELKRLLQKQRNLAQLKNRFISLISHEFRTPLTTIMLSADLLKRYSQAWDDNEKTKHYDRIKQTILSMTKMLENVTILSKIESKEIDIFPERINLTQFAQAMAETAALNMPSANVIQVTNLNQNIEEIVSDENLLGLSLINVIYNAIKFSDSDKGIEIETEVKEKIANIKIKDSGKGIKEQDLPYVTQAFYRGDNTVNVPGYGLGLAITKKSIEMLGGTLYINSTQNLGTVVSISIPRYFL